MRIEAYSFGRVVAGGSAYTSDVLVLGGGVIAGWWRRDGHSLCLDDLREVLPTRLGY